MARKNPELESLRKQVMARQRAAGKKISRLKAKGANVSGTKYDPRKTPATVSKLNVHQLHTQLGRLNVFMDRKTQFHSDARGALLPPGQFEAYKKLESKVNNIKKKAFDPIKNIKVPGGGGVTIAERHKINTPDRPRAGNPAVNPFTFVQRKSTSVMSAKALRKLTKDLENKLSSDFLAEDLALDRRVAADMLTTLGKPDWIDRLDKMSDFHFNILWNWTKFATDVSLPYELAKKGLQGEDASWHDETLAENLKNAGDLINDVQKIKLRR